MCGAGGVQKCQERARTKQRQGIGIWWSDYFHTDDHVECLPEESNGVDVDDLWRDETDGLIFDRVIQWEGSMDIVQCGGNGECAWEIVIGSEEGDKRITSGHCL